MELQFQKQEISFLRPVLNQVQNLEQTQELRIPEGMPEVGRIVLCRGQVLVRGKEWSGNSVRLLGGVQVWLLYIPEDGTAPQKLESWIPFQLDWDLPDNTPEGKIRFLPLLRFADARLISAGKIMLRVGIGVLAQGWSEAAEWEYHPVEMPEDVELLQESYPVRLPQEAGEKTFELEEELKLPASAPRPEKLVYCKMEPQVAEQKVMTNKLVFRGNGNLHILYLCEDGNLHTWDYELPFSQYAQLEKSYSADAQSDVTVAVTMLEAETDEEGLLHLKASLTGQYLVNDRIMAEVVSDIWSPYRELNLQQQSLHLPVQLENRMETVRGEQTVPALADVVTEVVLLPDFPRQRRMGDSMTLEQPGMIQLLWYDREGQLQGANHRWEVQFSIQADERTLLDAMPVSSGLQIVEGSDSITAHVNVLVQMMSGADWEVSAVTGLIAGEKQDPDPGRPSLILRRTGGKSLWEIARESGSTVAVIRGANDLEGEPPAEKMLLIPVV